MKLNYSGSGIVFYCQNEYKCDLYTNEDHGGILIKVNVYELLADFLKLPLNIEFLRGQLNSGYKFSLANCSRRNMTDMISENKSVYTYDCQYMFKGVGGKDCNQIKFNRMVFQLSDIIGWGEISGYKVGNDYTLLQNSDNERTLLENEKICAKYVVNSSMLPTVDYELLEEEITLNQSGNIEITFTRDESIEKFEDIFKMIKRLIELSTLKNLHLISLKGWSTDVYEVVNERRYDRSIEIISSHFDRNEEVSEKRDGIWKWITLSELVANGGFANYFLKYKLLEPIVDLFSEILESTDMSIVRVFLNIIQALETYHSRFITNDVNLFKDRIKLVILKNYPEENSKDYTEFLVAKSKGFITLESRLADLLLAEFKIIFETGDIKYSDFPNVIARTRNYYIHYDEKTKLTGRVLTEEELSIYNLTLFYMLEYYILLELGFSDVDKIRNKLNYRWGNPSQTLSLIRKSKEIDKMNVSNPS
jgi:hypothetical protein